MTWQLLNSSISQGREHFWDLPLGGKGGKLWIRLPAVEASQPIYLGIGNNNATPPGRFKGEFTTIENFEQFFSFEVPPFLENPFLGIRFQAEALQISPLFVLQETVSMAFYSNELAQLSRLVGTLRNQSLPVLSTPPSDGVGIDQFLFAGTGETVTRIGGYWLGELQMESKILAGITTADPSWEEADASSISLDHHFALPASDDLIMTDILLAGIDYDPDENFYARFLISFPQFGVFDTVNDWGPENTGVSVSTACSRYEGSTRVSPPPINTVKMFSYQLLTQYEYSRCSITVQYRRLYGGAS